MPRKGSVPKRDVIPDPLYGNILVTKFINALMLDGKRGIAESIMYDALEMSELGPYQSHGDFGSG